MKVTPTPPFILMPQADRHTKRWWINKNRHLQKSRARLHELKSRPCADCGSHYPPYVMDFDHRDRSTKRYTVSKMLGMSPARMLAEIEQCDVVCANCHRIRTYGGQQKGIDKVSTIVQSGSAR